MCMHDEHHIEQTLWLYALQAQQIRLETANAALLEGSGASWDAAFDEQWSLVQTVMPEA